MITRPRIVLMSDDPDDPALVTHSLAYLQPHAQLEHAATPEAIDRLLAAAGAGAPADGFDLLVLDAQLRAPDRLEVVRAFKARYPTAAVVMLVSRGGEQMAAEAIAAGVDNVVPKLDGPSPRPSPWLTTAIRSALNKRQEREQQVLAEALRDTATALTESLDFDEVLDRILTNVGRVVPYDVASIMLNEDGMGRVARSHSVTNAAWAESILEIRLPVADTPDLRQITAARAPLIISDTQIYPGWVQFPDTTWIRSHAGAPIYTRGQVIGFLNLDSATPGFFDQDIPPRLQAFADQAAIALNNAQLYRAAQSRGDQLAMLYDVGLVLSGEHNLSAVLRRLTATTLTALNADRASFYRFDADRQVLQAEFGIGYDDTALMRLRGRVVDLSSASKVSWAARHHASVHVPDTLAEPHWVSMDPLVRSAMFAPIEKQGTLYGVLGILSTRPNAFGAQDERLMRLFVNQAAAAMESARLLQAESEQRQLAETLRQVGAALVAELDTDKVLDCLLEQLSRVVPYDTANVLLLDGDLVHVVRGRGYEKLGVNDLAIPAYPVHSRATLRRMVETGQPVVISDVRNDPGWVHGADRRGADPQADSQGVVFDLQRSYAGVPIHVQGKLIGFLNVGSNTAGAFSSDHAARLQAFADEAGLALQNARLFSLLAEEKERIELVYSLSRQLAESLDVHEVAQRALEGICAVVGASHGIVMARPLAHTQPDAVVYVAIAGWTSEQLDELNRQTPLLVGEGLAGWVAAHRQAAIVGDVAQDARWKTVPGLDEWVKSVLSVPLLSGDDLVGVLSIYSAQAGFFNQDHLRLVESVAATVPVAMANARLYQAEREQFSRWQAAQARLAQAEKMSALGRLMASIAHEINNPLQAIQGCLTLVQEELEGERRQDRMDRYLTLAESEIERLANILKRVRESYRPAGQGVSPTDVQATLASVLELTGKQLQERHVTVESDWASALPLVQANPDHLRQVFLNLVINAMEAMPPGGVLRVRTSLDQMQDPRATGPVPAVRIEIADTGPGIPADVLPHLFEPFVSSHPEGAGLGLSISYGIIEAHHGHITVESDADKGTRFAIWLPAAA